MDAKQIVFALESGSLEEPKTVEAMAEAAQQIIAQQARIEQLKNHLSRLITFGCDATADGYDDAHEALSTPDDLTALRAHDVATSDSSFIKGVLMSASVLVATYDQPTMAGTILRVLGAHEADCFGLDNFYKKYLRKIEGVLLKGLIDRASAIEKGGA